MVPLNLTSKPAPSALASNVARPDAFWNRPVLPVNTYVPSAASRWSDVKWPARSAVSMSPLAAVNTSVPVKVPSVRLITIVSVRVEPAQMRGLACGRRGQPTTGRRQVFGAGNHQIRAASERDRGRRAGGEAQSQDGQRRHGERYLTK